MNINFIWKKILLSLLYLNRIYQLPFLSQFIIKALSLYSAFAYMKIFWKYIQFFFSLFKDAGNFNQLLHLYQSKYAIFLILHFYNLLFSFLLSYNYNCHISEKIVKIRANNYLKIIFKQIKWCQNYFKSYNAS